MQGPDFHIPDGGYPSEGLRRRFPAPGSLPDSTFPVSAWTCNGSFVIRYLTRPVHQAGLTLKIFYLEFSKRFLKPEKFLKIFRKKTECFSNYFRKSFRGLFSLPISPLHPRLLHVPSKRFPVPPNLQQPRFLHAEEPEAAIL